MNGSIRKRGEKSWELTIDVGRDATGKRLRKFINVKGTKKLAQEKLRELLTSLDKGIPVSPGKITLGEWLEKWLAEYVTPNCRPKTRERYEGVIRRHIVPALGHIELTKLTPRDVQAFESKLSSQGMKPAGVEVVHNTLSGALKYAMRMEVVWRNVAQAVTPPKVVRKEVEPPEIAIVGRILGTARRQEHPLFPCLWLIAYTGVRRGEALGLRWQDVSLEAGTISIVQTLGRSLEGLIFQPPKTSAGRRVVDLDDETIAVLRAHQGQQLLYKTQLEGAYEDQGLVFANPLGRPLNPMAVTRAFQSLAKKAGLEGANVHQLRHFHATVTLQSGQSIVTVSKRLGHASTSITADIYAHSMPGWQKEAANAFAKAMRQGVEIDVGNAGHQRRKLGVLSTRIRADKGVVPKVGVEPTRGCPHRFLRPARLPFRHFGRTRH